MNYEVTRPFRDYENTSRSKGDVIKLDGDRAYKLLRHRLIVPIKEKSKPIAPKAEVVEVKKEITAPKKPKKRGGK